MKKPDLNKYYWKMLAAGLGGSKQDFSWNEAKKMHTCCESKSHQQHKMNCLQVIGKDEEIGNAKWKELDVWTPGQREEYMAKIFA